MKPTKVASRGISQARDILLSVPQSVEGSVDPMGIVTPLLHAQLAWLSHPTELATAAADFSRKVLELQWHAWSRAAGMADPDVEKPHPDDTRFSDPVWQESATWDTVKEWYLLLTHEVQNMLYRTPGMSGKDRRRAAFWWRKWLNAAAPSNFLLTNPVAMRKAVESNGETLARGMRNFLADLQAGDVRLTDPSDFRVGVNLAVTHGKVVFRNRLLEVIHYAATQTHQRRTPIVIVTPWINKFYILDLNPKKSMIKYLLEQGFDVFITSWKNPGAEMRDVRFDDYLTEGVDQIVRLAQGIAGAPQVHAVGYCIGGAALTTYAAWAAKKYAGSQPLCTLTLLATLIDYQKPGDIEVFLDEGSVAWLSHSMASKGFLDGKEMAAAFRLLRSNSLIWHYIVHGYLYGETPPPFDVLYWNMDTTRMPAAMHTWYLREFYLHNNLVKRNALTVAGQQIDLEQISQPLYVVGAKDDHIAPWQQTFRLNAHVPGPMRYVLTSSGHILGIVNPPVEPPKREFWAATAQRHESAETWRVGAEHHVGSWWPDWIGWLKSYSGELVKARPLTSSQYRALADSPGSYVLEQ